MINYSQIARILPIARKLMSQYMKLQMSKIFITVIVYDTLCMIRIANHISPTPFSNNHLGRWGLQGLFNMDAISGYQGFCI